RLRDIVWNAAGAEEFLHEGEGGDEDMDVEEPVLGIVGVPELSEARRLLDRTHPGHERPHCPLQVPPGLGILFGVWRRRDHIVDVFFGNVEVAERQLEVVASRQYDRCRWCG